MVKKIFLGLVLLAALTLTACSRRGESEHEVYPEIPSDPVCDYSIFTTTMRIHDNLPYFTLHRILGDYLPEPHYNIPMPVEVTIIIENEAGEVIQTIYGLTQSNQWGSIAYQEITFADYNFDGYMDMRLHRWQDGAGGLLSHDYFWLWDSEQFQFVLNQQLTEMYAAQLTANQETKQIEVFNRGDNASHAHAVWEYHGGKFVRVFERFIRGVSLHSDMPQFIMQVDVNPIQHYPYVAEPHEVNIWFWDEDGIEVDHMQGLVVSGADWGVWVWQNIRFSDLNDDGYLDFFIWHHWGGEWSTYAHYYFLWCAETGRFATSGLHCEQQARLERMETFHLRYDTFYNYAAIGIATEEFLGRFDYVHWLGLPDYWGGGDVAIWAIDEPLVGFEFWQVDGRNCDIVWDFYFMPGEVLLALDYLPPNHAVVFRNHVGRGAWPAYGVSFQDTGGNRRHLGFGADLSGLNSPYQFIEIARGDGRMPWSAPLIEPWQRAYVNPNG